ncbi:WD40 repeat domain-containing protein [Mangrovibacterium lignilyticum]|uniref:WD40 repeat domain-containing protein n=1 Tax=Mangrovibacterium lignilyticum TaxID=2668052 RepID=UPI0013D274ED|nr:WD40 repeat domain-containing protein [Mangrovibacterium lignilyticum]
MRKFLLPLLLVLIVALGSIWYFMARETTSYSENSAFQAIPVRTPLVVELPEMRSLLKALRSTDPVVEELRTAGFLQPFWSDVDMIENLMAENETLRQAIQYKSVLVAFNAEGKSGVGAMFAFSLKNRSERDALIRYFKDLQQTGQGTVKQRDYDGQEVYQFNAGTETFYYAESKGIFLFSRNAIFVEEGIRQISSENLLSQEQFKQLYNTVSSSSDCNLFVNHKKIAVLLDKLIAPDFQKIVRKYANFSDWSELDVTMKASEFWLNGFSFAGKNYDNFLSVLRNQTGQRFRMDRVLSANTSFFVNFNLESFSRYQEDYAEFLKKQGSDFYNRETSLTLIERTGKKALIPLFEEISDNDFAMAFGAVMQNEPTRNRFFIAKIKGQSAAKELLLPVLENYAKSEKKSLADTESQYQLQKDVVYSIYEFPVKNLAGLLFGQVFSGVECNYLCFYDNYLIFADNEVALKNYIHDLVLSATMENDIHFQKFHQQMASRSSIYCYLNFSKDFNLGGYYLDEETFATVQKYEQLFRKFYALGWQISANSGAFLNNLYLRFDPVLKEEPQTVWQSKLDTTISIKPQVVTNHNDRLHKEVIVQDNKNNLYLINKEGVRLWKIKLSGKILGEVYQIDYYRNGKLQYLFNTREKLYLIDRNGNNVAKFPVSFRSPATNGVGMFDYDNNRDYRYFVACENKQIYAYDREGRIVDGWKADKTDGTVTDQLQHFRVDGKDFLVCADRYKTYILSRQGNIRVKTSDNFEHSGNNIYLVKAGQFALATTDTKGLVHLQYFTGESKKVDLGNFGKEHYFVAEDLNNDGQSDFVIADGKELMAYTDKGKKIMETDFSSPISSRPNIYTFSGNTKKIGVVCGSENRVYLVSTDGKLYDGFPLQGNTDFSIGYLSRENDYFNLLVGNEDNSFFNYKVE